MIESDWTVVRSIQIFHQEAADYEKNVNTQKPGSFNCKPQVEENYCGHGQRTYYLYIGAILHNFLPLICQSHGKIIYIRSYFIQSSGINISFDAQALFSHRFNRGKQCCDKLGAALLIAMVTSRLAYPALGIHATARTDRKCQE